MLARRPLVQPAVMLTAVVQGADAAHMSRPITAISAAQPCRASLSISSHDPFTAPLFNAPLVNVLLTHDEYLGCHMSTVARVPPSGEAQGGPSHIKSSVAMHVHVAVRNVTSSTSNV